jgi:hypothetical protein
MSKGSTCIIVLCIGSRFLYFVLPLIMIVYFVLPLTMIVLLFNLYDFHDGCLTEIHIDALEDQQFTISRNLIRCYPPWSGDISDMGNDFYLRDKV